ncbi:unnamed protein product [Phytophthora fragariaefolia]|uniref:Unnamed protein product n=1 Tax=Phytophthora fragariaefolia TaxID=1490495 RepID=A0A9W6XQX4_9STRA|nr:unnamed protein product [Phytophthora fragariaefolia]
MISAFGRVNKYIPYEDMTQSIEGKFRDIRGQEQYTLFREPLRPVLPRTANAKGPPKWSSEGWYSTDAGLLSCLAVKQVVYLLLWAFFYVVDLINNCWSTGTPVAAPAPITAQARYPSSFNVDTTRADTCSSIMPPIMLLFIVNAGSAPPVVTVSAVYSRGAVFNKDEFDLTTNPELARTIQIEQLAKISQPKPTMVPTAEPESATFPIVEPEAGPSIFPSAVLHRLREAPDQNEIHYSEPPSSSDPPVCKRPGTAVNQSDVIITAEGNLHELADRR